MKIYNPFYRRLTSLLFVITLFILLGAFGFMYSEGVNFLDAVWYSSMTLTTVGFGVPDDFSDLGKLNSIFLMVFGVGFVLYGLSSLALEVFGGSFAKEYKNKLISKKMKSLENHIIICGFGRNGRQAARKLLLHKKPFVIVDRRELETRADEFHNTIFIKGNAVEDDVLEKAGIKKALGVIACLPSDADNLFIVISSKQLNPNLKIVSRASNSNTISKLKSAGAENVIMPDKIGGEHMASLLVTPDLVEFMDNIALEGTKNINLVELHTNGLPENFFGGSLSELKIEEQTGCKIIGYKNITGDYIINPDHYKTIEKDCCIIVLGQPQQIEILQRIYKKV